MYWSWGLLVLAGMMEIAWANGLRYTDGFTKPLPTIGVLVGIAISMALVAVASKEIPLGIAYSVWVGIGATGIVLSDVGLGYSPMLNPMQAFFLGTLILSIVGLKMTG